MARLSKEEHDQILKSLSESANASPEMMDFIGKLRDDFDESLKVDSEETIREWENKYNRVVGERDEVRRAYRERFFTSAETEAEKIVNREKEDSPRGINAVLGIKDEEVL